MQGQPRRVGAPFSTRTGGIETEPSASWRFSMIAISVRPTATAVPFSVWTGCSGGAPSAGPVAAAQSPRLVVGRVRGRGELPVSLLARDPGLAVELAGRGGAEIADRDVDDPVGDLERGEDALLDREQALVLVLRRRRLDEREHLDLVELVDAEDPAGVLAGGAGLAAEAGRDPGVASGSPRLDDLVGVQGGEGDLGGADQEQLVLGDLVDHLPLAGEEPGPEQRALADQDRRHDRREPLLAEQLDGEADQRQLDQHEVAEQVGEAGARGGGGLLGLDQAEGAADVEMVADLEAEPGRSPTSRRTTASSSVVAVGRLRVGRVGNRRREPVAIVLDRLELGLELLDPG